MQNGKRPSNGRNNYGRSYFNTAPWLAVVFKKLPLNCANVLLGPIIPVW